MQKGKRLWLVSKDGKEGVYGGLASICRDYDLLYSNVVRNIKDGKEYEINGAVIKAVYFNEKNK